MADYRIVPRKLVHISALLVSTIEIVLAFGLLIPLTRVSALFGSAALLTIYAAAIGFNLLRGRRHIDCGCMGPLARQSLSGWLVIRNLTISLAAVYAAGALVARPLVWLDILTIGAGVTVLAISYTAVNHLIAIAPELARLRY